MNDQPSKRRFKKQISVTFMSGPYDGKKLSFDQPDIGEQTVLTIGRRENCDIYLGYDNQVSRLHARLGCASVPVTDTDSSGPPSILTFWLEDSGSRNGTYMEKEDTPIDERVSLRPGTLFRIGRTWLRLDIPMSYGM